jgi:protein-S-isoprenylcysteine O-methyltransferase Ste14
MIEILAYMICAAIWLGIIFGWLIPVIKKRIVNEIYVACGLGIMFSLIVLGHLISKRGNILPLVYIGYAFYIPAAVFVIFSHTSLKHKGKQESGWEHTTKLIESGVYRIVRHPLYLGSALFTIGIILLIQSIPSMIFGLVAIFCFWTASNKEDKFNIKKFGDSYRIYMKKVPMWNFLRVLKKLKRDF